MICPRIGTSTTRKTGPYRDQILKLMGGRNGGRKGFVFGFNIVIASLGQAWLGDMELDSLVSTLYFIRTWPQAVIENDGITELHRSAKWLISNTGLPII